jgi:hypothetical protein
VELDEPRRVGGSVQWAQDQLGLQLPWSAVFKFEKSGMVGTGMLPPGWTTGFDEQSQQQFYVNQQTGQSQWEVPQY